MRRFLIDNQLPAALARWITAQGEQAEHVLSLGLGQAFDPVIWNQAAATAAVIVTKDEDFAQLILVRPEPVAVIWLRLGNCRNAVLLLRFEQLWPEIIRQLDSGARLIEVH